jgi:hypothetical protein
MLGVVHGSSLLWSQMVCLNSKLCIMGWQITNTMVCNAPTKIYSRWLLTTKKSHTTTLWWCANHNLQFAFSWWNYNLKTISSSIKIIFVQVYKKCNIELSISLFSTPLTSHQSLIMMILTIGSHILWFWQRLKWYKFWPCNTTWNGHKWVWTR